MDIKNIVSTIGAGGALTGVTIILGRMWTKSYYSVFGLPTEDLNLDVWDYAFRTKEVLVMLLVGALVGGTLAVLASAEPRIIGTGMVALLFSLGLALGLFMFYLAQSKPAWADFVWGSHGILGFVGGVAVGLLVGGLAILVQRVEGLWRALSAVAILALLTLFLPWSTTELAQFKAERDIRGGLLSQAVIEFEKEAPASIRRRDDPMRSDVVHLVLATPTRLAVAYPFGCESVGIQGRMTEDSPRLQSETCDIFTFDREDVRSIRIFGKGTQRPFNDEPSSADVVVLGPDAPTEFDNTIDLTAARSDRCGRRGVDLDPNDPKFDKDLAHGVWYRLDAAQSGRIVVDRESAPVYFTAAIGAGSRCHRAFGTEGEGWHLGVGDRVFLLAASRSADRVEKRLRFLFVPLDFRPTDIAIAAPRQATTPFAVLAPARIEVTVEGNRAFELASGCRPLKSGRVTVAPLGRAAPLALCPTGKPKTGARSVTLVLLTPLDEGIWELRVNLEPPDLQSYRIRLTPIES